MIRYTFYLDQGNIVSNEKEDLNFEKFAQKMHDLGFIAIEGEQEFYINPEKIKCVSREIVNEQEVEAPPAKDEAKA